MAALKGIEAIKYRLDSLYCEYSRIEAWNKVKEDMQELFTTIATLQSTLEATERELIVYKGGHALDGGTLASLWAERVTLRTALAAAQEDVRVMTRAVCEAAIVVEALEIAERGGTALCPEMQTQITIAASGMRASLARPTVRQIMEQP